MAKSESEMTWKDLEIGCIVTEPGSARHTKAVPGARSAPPMTSTSASSAASAAYTARKAASGQNKEGYFEANLYYCKGCGICARECWPRVIKMVEEEE